MNEVRLDLNSYDELKCSCYTKAERIDALEHELKKVKCDHEDELDKLTKEGKVRIIEKPIPNLSAFVWFLRGKRPKPKYKGFDDVKAEVEEHFKQGLFNEELEKQKKEQLANLVKQDAEKETMISDLKAEIRSLKSRSLWERIRNK